MGCRWDLEGKQGAGIVGNFQRLRGFRLLKTEASSNFSARAERPLGGDG